MRVDQVSTHNNQHIIYTGSGAWYKVNILCTVVVQYILYVYGLLYTVQE